MNTVDLLQHYTYQQSDVIETVEEMPIKHKIVENKKIKINKFAYKEKFNCGKKCLIKERIYRKDHKIIKLK